MFFSMYNEIGFMGGEGLFKRFLSLSLEKCFCMLTPYPAFNIVP